MNKANHVLKAALAAAGLVGAVTMSALPVVAVAQDPKPPKLNAKVQKALAGAQEAIQAKDWAKAKEGIDAARAVEGKGPYDEFMISELSGFVQLNQKDYAAAAASFEATVKSGYVPAADLPQRNKVLSQLYFQTENYPKAIEYGNQYLASAPTDQAIGDLVARGYFLQKDYANARSTAKKVADASAKPTEQILQVMLASNLELDDRPGIFATLESLVKHYPQPKYWNDLLNNQLFASKTRPRAAQPLPADGGHQGPRQVRGIHGDGHRARCWRFPERSQARAGDRNVAGRAGGGRQGSCASRNWSVPARAPSRIARSLPARTRRSRRPRPATTWCRSASSTSARARMPSRRMPSRRAWPRAVSATPTTQTPCSASRWRARPSRRRR